MRALRWVLFLVFLVTSYLSIGLREDRGTRLTAENGHFYVTLGTSQREVGVGEFHELQTRKTLSWTLFWTSALACVSLALLLAWQYEIDPYLQARGR